MKFLDVFNPIVKGSHGLTDEAIYASIQRENIIPLYGGNSQHETTERFISKKTKTIDGDDIIVFSGEGIVISLDGSAGCMTYKNGETFALNHHAGFITVKDGCKESVNLKYFAIFMQNHYKALSVSEGSKTLSLSQIYTDEFSLPNKDIQDRIVYALQGLISKNTQLSQIYNKLETLLEKTLIVNYKKYQGKKIPINNVIGHVSGHSGLTEEFIYSTLLLPGKRYKVKSSSTSEETLIGYVPKCTINGSPIRVNSKHETLLVARNGKVGKTEYLVDECYTINDHAYILYVKEGCNYKLNLKWLSIQYRSEIMNYSSSSANSTWNMTGFFKNVVIDIPDYSEQMQIVEMYDKAERLKNKIESLRQKMDILLSKEVSS